jgi:hypothetical protein
MKKSRMSCLHFLSKLQWLDGRPLLDTVEEYRREIFRQAFDEVGDDGKARFNLVLAGRGKKNSKSADLDLAALYAVVGKPKTAQGNVGLLIANSEDQAADDLDLLKKLILCNPLLRSGFEIFEKHERMKDGSGQIEVLPSRDVAALHGKTFSFLGLDEIHEYKNWNILEALQPDPSRADCLTWVTSYDGVSMGPGMPLFDLKEAGKAGSDPRMLFSWYSGEFCTDPNFANLETPEERANPSKDSWADKRYLETQRRRLPTSKYRRLHLNLPAAPSGAFFEQSIILDAVVKGRRYLPPEDGIKYGAYADMGGGSHDNSTLAIGHLGGPLKRHVIVNLVEKQAGKPPYSPRQAALKFAQICKGFKIHKLYGDRYAGRTFIEDFGSSIAYTTVSPHPSATELYEYAEPIFNAGEVELIDHQVSIEEALALVRKGAKVTHESNGHDDHINAIAGLIWALREQASTGFVRDNAYLAELNRVSAPQSNWRNGFRGGGYATRQQPPSLYHGSPTALGGKLYPGHHR